MRTYRPRTAAEALRAIERGESPWLATGEFLDDFYRATPEEKRRLVEEPPPPVRNPENHRWAAYLAAAVDYLAWKNAFDPPAWVGRPEYILPEPWFLREDWRFRAWLLFKTPPAFLVRNIFCGDRELDRV